MPDPVDPSQPPPSPVSTPPPVASESDVTGKPTSTGLPSNVAAAIACIPLVGGIIFYILEKHDSFVRFYAMQSIIFGGASLFFWIVYVTAFTILTPIPGIGFVFKLLFWGIRLIVGVGFLVIWIIATVKAFTNVRWDIPYVGPIARKQVGESAV
jgi:uncharacterized membrane protein